MHISITGRKQGDLKQDTKRRAYSKVQSNLQRFAARIARVELVVEDLSGPHGSATKRCLAKLTLNDGNRLMIDHRHQSSGAAIACAINRLRQTLRRHSERALARHDEARLLA